MVVPERLARFGAANHGLRGVRAGFWTNRAKNPDAHFSFGTVCLWHDYSTRGEIKSFYGVEAEAAALAAEACAAAPHFVELFNGGCDDPQPHFVELFNGGCDDPQRLPRLHRRRQNLRIMLPIRDK